MITNLRMQNFRRHEDTELALSTDAQIVLISGRNGAGKTTILEAITYALYGEGRHGANKKGGQLSKLVRRGAEYEGMQVDLTFTVGDNTYQVVRRYERGNSTATLYANGTNVQSGSKQVTAQIGAILGMDVVGFRTAVIAQQKELDGLASLTDAKRRETMGRLLRLDKIRKAAKVARERYNRELDIANALGSGPDFDTLNSELAAETAALELARVALTDSRDVIVQIDAELAASAAIEDAWRAAQINVATADALASAAQSECDRIDAELRQVRVPEAVAAPARSLDDIRAALTAVEGEIARGEGAKRLAEQAAAIRRELTVVSTRLEAITAEVGDDTPASLGMLSATVQSDLAAAETALAELEERRNTLLSELAGTRSRIEDLKARQARAATLGDVCDACEQDIPESHKHAQAERRVVELVELTAAEEKVLADGAVMKSDREALQAKVAELRAGKDDVERRRVALTALMREQSDLERRRATYTGQLDRLEVVDVDLDELYARKSDLAIEETQAREADEVARVRELATARRDQLSRSLDEAKARLNDALTAKAAAEPDADLAAAYARRQETAARRAAELELCSACESEVSAAVERVAAAQRRISDAHGHADKARQHKEAAAIAAKTAQLLTDVADRLATEIRPALEGEIAKMLTLLSEGRFTAAKVSDDYQVSILDDGKFEPLSEFSGGEADLIALAVRLALANVIAERHGAGGVGFLILDEVFGSQDAARREAIVSGLRNLRGIYGQILLISHVGGLNDEADLVLDVSATGADRTAEVLLAA